MRLETSDGLATPTPTPTPTPTSTLTPTCSTGAVEAEAGSLFGAFGIGSDTGASGGQYVHVPNGTLPDESGPNANRAEYCFQVAAAGVYRIKTLAQAPLNDADSDTFYVTVDGLPAAGYHWDLQTSAGFQEVYVNDLGMADPLEVSLTAGAHLIAVHLREDGTRLDRLWLEPAPSLPPTVPPPPACSTGVIEAEAGMLSGDFVVGSDPAASGEAFIHVPESPADSPDGIADNPHQAQYCFRVTAAGSYRLKGRIEALDGDEDSFFVTVDGAPAAGYLWELTVGSGYRTDYVGNRGGPDPVVLNLAVGDHTVIIYQRENGAKLDSLELEPVTGGNGGWQRLDALGTLLRGWVSFLMESRAGDVLKRAPKTIGKAQPAAPPPGTIYRSYYYAGGQRVAMRVQGDPDPLKNGVFYLLSDHLGSTNVVVDQAGQEVSELRYKAWGETRYAQGETPTDYAFTGQRAFDTIKLIQMDSRWYEPYAGTEIGLQAKGKTDL